MPKLEYLRRPRLKKPKLIAGLPGIANVGKLAIEFMIHQLRAKRFIALHSEHLPEWAIPEGGIVRPLRVDFYHTRPEGLDHDLILLSADAQASTPEGQYILTSEILDLAEEQGVTTVGTMAAYVLAPEEGRRKGVVGTATSSQLTNLLKEKGVELLRGGVIVGMNGILPGLAALRGMEGFCLLGTTEGGLIDPKASSSVVQMMANVLGFSIDTSELMTHASELRRRLPEPPKEERPTYIG
jgi:hypothetical protein